MVAAMKAPIVDTEEQRFSARHVVSLSGALGGGQDVAVIANLSPTGVMVESPLPCAVGDRLTFDFPEVGPTDATVVWNREGMFGCEFDRPLSRAGVSAALLKSPALASAGGMVDAKLEAEPADGYSPRAKLALAVFGGAGAWALVIAGLRLIFG